MAAACRLVLALAVSACATLEPAAAAASRPIQRGQADYAAYCAPCHGSRGAGDGPMARMLAAAPARHDDAAFMSRRSDEYVFQLLKDGGSKFGKSPLMGAWGKILSEDRIRDLVAYIRFLSR